MSNMDGRIGREEQQTQPEMDSTAGTDSAVDMDSVADTASVAKNLAREIGERLFQICEEGIRTEHWSNHRYYKDLKFAGEAILVCVSEDVLQ